MKDADRIGAMMTEQKIAGKQANAESVSFAKLPENIVVVRITGRGSFHNSMEVRRLADAISVADGAHPRYIVDLSECITMDSTFMGVLASIGLRQLRETGEKLVVANANEQNVRLLNTLGLSQFIAVRQATATAAVSDTDFKCMIKEEASRREQIIHMIEAHKDLCEADPSNNLRFESVLKYLQDSLKQEK